MPTLSKNMIQATQTLSQAVDHLLKSGILDPYSSKATMVRGDLAHSIYQSYNLWQQASCQIDACSNWTLPLPQSSQALFQSVDLSFEFNQERIDELKNKDCLVIIFGPEDIERMEQSVNDWQIHYQQQPQPQQRKIKNASI